jgi:hypothetical protein
MTVEEILKIVKEAKSHTRQAIRDLIDSKVDWGKLKDEFRQAGFSDGGIYWRQGYDDDFDGFYAQLAMGSFFWVEFEGKTYAGFDKQTGVYALFKEHPHLESLYKKIDEGNPQIEELEYTLESLPDEILEELGCGEIFVYEDNLQCREVR